MSYRTPHEKRARMLRLYPWLLALVACFVFVSLLDFPAIAWFVTIDPQTRVVDRSVAGEDWYMLLRIAGSIWTWVLLCVVVVALGRGARMGLALLSAPLLAGLLAELLKLVVARERPVDGAALRDGLYAMRVPFSGFIDGSNLGFPSSHAATAFGGAVMLGFIEPRLRAIALLLALGCAWSRLPTGAHYASDVFAGAVIGAAIGVWVASIQPRGDRKFTL